MDTQMTNAGSHQAKRRTQAEGTAANVPRGKGACGAAFTGASFTLVLLFLAQQD